MSFSFTVFLILKSVEQIFDVAVDLRCYSRKQGTLARPWMKVLTVPSLMQHITVIRVHLPLRHPSPTQCSPISSCLLLSRRFQTAECVPMVRSNPAWPPLMTLLALFRSVLDRHWVLLVSFSSNTSKTWACAFCIWCVEFSLK